MRIIKKVTINPYGNDLVASVECKNPINLCEEDKIRKMLGNFYTQKAPNFARLAIQIAGTTILFRVISNGKRTPDEGDIEAVLKAINCYPIERSRVKLQPPVACRQAMA